MNWAIALLLISSGDPVDNGWDVEDPPPCQEVLTLGFLTTPISLRLQNGVFSFVELNAIDDAIEWWNAQGLGDLFCLGCVPSFINTVFVYPEVNTTHEWNYIRGGDCAIFQSQIVIPRTSQSSDIFAEYVHMLGHAIGLAEDSTAGSVMNASVASSVAIAIGATALSASDFDLLLYMQVY